MIERRSLRRSDPGMGPRNGMVELDEALVIAVGHILLVPTAARGAVVRRGEKAVHDRLGSVAEVLFRLRGNPQQRAHRSLH